MDQNAGEEFVRQLTVSQSMLMAYISSLLPDASAAADVLQETNLVLWRQSDQFAQGTNFGAWARRVAYFQVLAHYRDRGRESLVFDVDLLDTLSREREQEQEALELQRARLRRCLAKLPAGERQLLARRYSPGASVQSIAQQTGKSVGAVSQSLYRIRQMLMNCVQADAARQEGC